MSFWSDSIAQGLKIGAIYSTGVPLTTEESCNAIGQVYHGPVVLIIDALGYSTTDIFAAGFQDHQIGTILGTNSNTGAAGANVWEHDELRALAGGRGNLRRLPRDAGMRVALLRSIRVGKNAGQPLEELGVTPDQEHQLTRDDILHGNRDLIGRAATILSGAPVRELTATLSSPASDGSRTLTATTRRIYRLEAHSGNQQFDSTDGLAACDTTQFRVAASKLAAGKLSLQGYDRRGRLIAMRRITLPD
jgi:hypothetical protein